MFNWYLSENFRLEFNYGYSDLDRSECTAGRSTTSTHSR
jgi:hypothetical protein